MLYFYITNFIYIIRNRYRRVWRFKGVEIYTSYIALGIVNERRKIHVFLKILYNILDLMYFDQKASKKTHRNSDKQNLGYRSPNGDNKIKRLNTYMQQIVIIATDGSK